MANSMLTFVFCAVGGFTGALIGNAFTKTDYFGGDPRRGQTLGIAAVSCPPAPTCPRCEQHALQTIGNAAVSCPPAPTCPRCEQHASASAKIATDCPVCEDPAAQAQSDPAAEPSGDGAEQGGGDAANAKSFETSEGHPVALRAPAPAPKGSYNYQDYYPLHNTRNRFEAWYDKRRTGKGVWKWTQYFPAWERHFAKFIAKSWAGEEVHMAELGIFSGGSLEMWQAVFGPGLRLWGVDIATVTKQYETDDKSGRTKIFNMDQTSAESWEAFKKAVPKLDILIDDGLHVFNGQKATFDNIVDHIAPGGVFMTEDISDGTRPGKPASSHDGAEHKEKYLDYSYAKMRSLHYERSHVQDTIDSIHYYPYLFVIEKREVVLRPHGSGKPLTAIKHGTDWKPITHGVVKGEHAGR